MLARDTDDPGTPGVAAPTWREEDADWVAHDDQFEPAMFGTDQVALGSLDESDRTNVERRPWEFDLDPVRPGSPSPSRRVSPEPGLDANEGTPADPITEETEVISRPEGELPRPTWTGRPGRPGRPAARAVGDRGGRPSGRRGGARPHHRGEPTVQLGGIEPPEGDDVTILGAVPAGPPPEASGPPTEAVGARRSADRAGAPGTAGRAGTA